jgi:hypothetical protein
MRNRSAVLFLVAGVLVSTACGEHRWPWEVPPPTGPTTSNNTTVIVNNGTTPNASATPGLAPGSTIGFVQPASVRVGIYGQACPSEVRSQIPDNAQNAIVVGCTADFTATPKRADGSMQTPAEHGPDVTWSVQGASCRDMNAAPNDPNPERFNRAITGAARGTCTVCATVQGVTGCAVQTPSGERIVRVVDPY